MKHQRLMTLLPALPEQPEAPPAPLHEVLGYIEDSLEGSHSRAADALLQHLDCQNVESVLLEQESFDERAPRTREQIENNRDLPDYMAEFIESWQSGGQTGAYPIKELWSGYYRHLTEVAQDTGSSFLRDWSTWEISLRNALAETRADSTDMEVEDHTVERPHNEPNHEALLLKLREASDPLARQRHLDGERLATIEGLRGTDPFSLDAVLAYLASSLILDRWDLPETPDPQALLDEMK